MTSKRTLRIKDIKAALKEIDFRPEDSLVKQIYEISDADYFCCRVIELLYKWRKNPVKKSRDEDLVMAARLLLAMIVDEKVKNGPVKNKPTSRAGSDNTGTDRSVPEGS